LPRISQKQPSWACNSTPSLNNAISDAELVGEIVEILAAHVELALGLGFTGARAALARPAAKSPATFRTHPEGVFDLPADLFFVDVVAFDGVTLSTQPRCHPAEVQTLLILQ
jgi:hypothetical protein